MAKGYTAINAPQKRSQRATFRYPRDGDCHVVLLTPEFQALQHEDWQQQCHPPGCPPRIAPPFWAVFGIENLEKIHPKIVPG